MMINTLGCTQVFSKGLLDQAIKIANFEETNFKGMPNHDGWMYLTAVTYAQCTVAKGGSGFSSTPANSMIDGMFILSSLNEFKFKLR